MMNLSLGIMVSIACVWMMGPVHGEDDLEPRLAERVVSPDKKSAACFDRNNGRSRVSIESDCRGFDIYGVFIIRPLIWAGDSSGVFALEHIARGNCLSFLRVKDGRGSKIPIDPDWEQMKGQQVGDRTIDPDKIHAYQVIGMTLSGSVTRIEFLVTLYGETQIDRYWVRYFVNFDSSDGSMRDPAIKAVSDEELQGLLNQFTVRYSESK